MTFPKRDASCCGPDDPGKVSRRANLRESLCAFQATSTKSQRSARIPKDAHCPQFFENFSRNTLPVIA
jgi:hypothetical protein